MVLILPLLISIHASSKISQPAKTRMAAYQSVISDYKAAMDPLPSGPDNQQIRFMKLRPFLEKSIDRLSRAQTLPLYAIPSHSGPWGTAFDFPDEVVRVDLIRNLAHMAEAQLQGGNPVRASRTICIAEDMSLDRTTSGVISFLTAIKDIANLSSVVINNIDRWDKGSLDAFLDLSRRMAAPSRFRLVIENSIRSVDHEARKMIPELLKDNGEEGSDVDVREFVKWIHAIPPSKRRVALGTEIGIRVKKLQQVFQWLRPPEYKWPLSDAAFSLALKIEPKSEFLDLITTRGMATLPKMIAKSATIARIFGLYVRVQMYRLEHRKFPANLPDAVLAGEAFDTLANRNFGYSVAGNKVNIWSEGNPDVGGKIELKPRNRKS